MPRGLRTTCAMFQAKLRRARGLDLGCGLLPDRDVLDAVARERLPLPATPAVAQRHSAKLCHQVELSRPRVPEGNREARELSVDDPEVMRDETLSRHVVLVETPARRAHVEGIDGLAGRELPERRDAYLDHEAATGLEVRGDVPEARDLSRLCGQVHDRVEDEIRDR